ncbi:MULTISPECIES: DUF4402 domain-containing protein [Pseudoalteromonas]|uniref:DUF4402 domain-containing protein n=1 Tax=Pseudoalteromonas obscura TaxID=3048491 RepID=A0ABT7EI07_9GAMM|nr:MULTISPECIES: DUF4402 domain-containing protein [Pseudoalteromonas]MBQ4836341.1 DUF4402 domain-containing protein [Pseudoalteromonas luteoviolacea]MDK2594691.1 DUF4402 domain-containing protein [Pseudoalteromonas sp. P94(2023)]
MKKNLKQLGLMTAIAVLPFSSFSAQKATFDAKVKVKNAFQLVKNNDLDFGTIRAVADNTGTDTASLTIPADTTQTPTVASTNVNNAEIAIISAGSPAQFQISGVVPFATLSITDPVETDVSLAAGSGSGAAGFKLGSFTYYIETGASNSTPVVGKQIQVNENGEAVFNIGATLSTTTGNSANYLDGDYIGTFTLEVSY